MKPGDPTRDPSVFVKHRLERLDQLGLGVWPCFKPGEETHEGVVLYRRDELIACARTKSFVGRQLQQRFGKRVASDKRADFTIFRLPEGVDSLDLAARLRCEDANVSPHPVLNLAQGVPRIGPGDDPRPHAPTATTAARKLRSKHRVGIVDTGVLKEAARGPVVPASVDQPDVVNPTQVIDWYGAAHGTFIQGIYQRQSPGVSVSHWKAVDNAGLVTLDSFVSAVDAAVEDGVDVLNLSLGMYAAPGMRIPGLKAAVARWIATCANQGRELLIAAAAGNDSKSQPFYPAAFSTDPDVGFAVMAVGALDHPDDNGEKRPASFSNFGDWVNAWAPGVDLVSDYAGGGLEFVYGDGSHAAFSGSAEWSGTSFATPYAAAAVLSHAASKGVTARQAWHDIRGGRPWVLFD